jgi:predicted Co/Zn/Cd cation transporter (cation efflux family)
MKENSQNWKNIYVLPFQIMASCYFFIHMNVKEFKSNIHLITFFD